MSFRSPFWMRIFVLVTFGGGVFVTAVATEIKERLPNGLEVNAEFTQGQSDKPAVLILHGFLQTYNNATVSNLASAISNAGYSVLAPTLSLGISNRRQTLSCETPHPHLFAEDVAEIDFWDRWLVRHGAASIVLIGHSTGNVQLLAYASEHKHAQLKKIITISLINYAREFGGQQNLAQYHQAQHKVKSGNTQLGEYKLSYCNKYVAPAQAYLSYAEWDENKLLKTIRGVPAPIVVIAGDADERMRDGWLDKLRALPVQITKVKGANHFFSDVHEFDLHDRVIESLSN